MLQIFTYYRFLKSYFMILIVSGNILALYHIYHWILFLLLIINVLII